MNKIELLKFLLVNVTGKVAAVITAALGTLYMVAPQLPKPWSGLASRAQVACFGYLIAIMFWRGLRIDRLVATSVAKQIVDDPRAANTSPDPIVQREIDTQVATTARETPLNGTAKG